MSEPRDRDPHDASGPPPIAEGSSAAAEGSPAAAELFEILWEAIADILGSAATAAMMRRAAKRASSRDPSLRDLEIRRQGLGYAYVTPPGWQERDPALLGELLRELRPLLVELTGAVVVLRLTRIPELQRSGLFSPEQEQP